MGAASAWVITVPHGFAPRQRTAARASPPCRQFRPTMVAPAWPKTWDTWDAAASLAGLLQGIGLRLCLQASAGMARRLRLHGFYRDGSAAFACTASTGRAPAAFACGLPPQTRARGAAPLPLVRTAPTDTACHPSVRRASARGPGPSPLRRRLSSPGVVPDTPPPQQSRCCPGYAAASAVQVLSRIRRRLSVPGVGRCSASEYRAVSGDAAVSASRGSAAANAVILGLAAEIRVRGAAPQRQRRWQRGQWKVERPCSTVRRMS
jgi:hypothetical protein